MKPFKRGSTSVLSVFAIVLLAGAGCGPEKHVRPTVGSMEAYVKQAHAREREVVQSPGSLFNQAAPTRDLFSDPRARMVDDIVTIRVVESTSALSSADASTKNSSNMSNSISNLAGLENKLTSLPNMVNATGEKTFDGEGSTNRKSVISTTLSARVIDVLPNGNLVIESSREMTINNEVQTLIVTGVIRPQDVSFANEVLSNNIANMKVFLQGSGDVARSIKPGWLFKILHQFLPF